MRSLEDAEIYEDRYAVFEDGVIVRINEWADPDKAYLGRVLEGSVMRNDRVYVGISTGKRKRNIMQKAKVIAECYVRNPHNFSYVEHIDGNKFNFHADNLKWVESTESQKANFNNTLRDFYKSDMYKYTLINIHTGERTRFKTMKDIAEYVGVTMSPVSRAIHRKFKLQGTYRVERDEDYYAVRKLFHANQNQ